MKRTLCGWSAGVSLLIAYGVAGGMECSTTPATPGTAALLLFFVLLFGMAAWAADQPAFLPRRKPQQRRR